MTEDRDTELALALLRSQPSLLEDARDGAAVGNTIAGGLLTRPLGPIGARWAAEAAVARALRILDNQAKHAS